MNFNGFVNRVAKGKSSTAVVTESAAVITAVSNSQPEVEVDQQPSSSQPTSSAPADSCESCGRPFHPVPSVCLLAPSIPDPRLWFRTESPKKEKD